MREEKEKKHLVCFYSMLWEFGGEGLTSIAGHDGSKHLSRKIRKRKISRFLQFFLFIINFSSFFFFSLLELTFSLAANETKRRCVIRVDVFI